MLAAYLVQNRKWGKETLQTPERQSLKICTYQSVFYRVAKTSACGFSLDHHVDQRSPWNELRQLLPENPSIREEWYQTKLFEKYNYIRVIKD